MAFKITKLHTKNKPSRYNNQSNVPIQIPEESLAKEQLEQELKEFQALKELEQINNIRDEILKRQTRDQNPRDQNPRDQNPRDRPPVEEDEYNAYIKELKKHHANEQINRIER